MDDDLARAKERWERERVEPTIRKVPERKPAWRTSSGISLDRLYTPADVPVATSADHARIGFPGEYPFTRGIHPTLYRGQLWTMRQYAGYQSAEDSNRRYRYLLERGQTGLSVAFDLPTQIGYDSDHPLARGEVGRVGVPISSIRDMEKLLEGIPLDKVSVSMTINATAMVLLALVVAVGKRRGVPAAALRGTVQNDILKEYIARGTYRFPPKPSLRLVTDTIAFAAKEMPKWNPISISGYHIREAGATAAEELAFTFADAIAYVEAARARGLAIDDFAPQLSFFFNAHNELLEEVAKDRAARRIFAEIMRDRFGAKNERSLLLRFHVQTAGSTLTSQQHENNVVRVTIQALAAVLGGCQSLHTNSRDEALSLPSDEAQRLALRPQQIIAYESGVAGTVDPLGGSWAIESLTDRIEAEVRRILERIDAQGGTLACIERGVIQEAIAESAYRAQKAIEKGEQAIVGVNLFVEEDEPAPKGILRIDPSVEERRREELAHLRRTRAGDVACRALGELRRAASQPSENLVPYVIDCVEKEVTVGEICKRFADLWGEHREGEGQA